jgi:Cu2+-exporting ATPase
VRRIIFDKTGTLTLETPVLVNPEALSALGAEDRRALYTLVRGSPHPVSQCLHEQMLLEGEAGAPGNGEIQEEVGFGLRLRAGGDCWTLGRPGWQAPSSDVTYCVTNPGDEAGLGESEFRRNGTVLARFRFAEAVRADARLEIDALRASGCEVYLLSGDRPAKVEALAGELGLPVAQAIGGAPPEEKAAWVRRLDRQDTLMLGDGANDSLAFERALCRGTPVVHRGVLESKADFYYLGRGIGGIRRLLEIDRLRARTQRAVLVFAVAYNAAAVGWAVAGHVNPLLAAILMPASSLLTLGIVGVSLRSCLR